MNLVHYILSTAHQRSDETQIKLFDTLRVLDKIDLMSEAERTFNPLKTKRERDREMGRIDEE
jgi:hypothetical protein